MRPFAALFLGILVLAPPVTAHTTTGDAQTHLSVRPVQLAAGGNASYSIETGEGPWMEGMVFVLYVQFANDARRLNAQLVYAETEVVANWTLEADMRQRVSTRIPFDDGPYEMRFKNLDANQTQFWYFFDQTCNCAFKPVPLDESWVVFHYDLKKGRRTSIGFPLVPGWTVEGVLATLRSERASYPEDFDVLENKTASGQGWLYFNVTAPSNERYYLFMTAKEGSPVTPRQDVFVSLTPLVEVAKDSPAPGLLVLLLGVGVALAWRRR